MGSQSIITAIVLALAPIVVQAACNFDPQCTIGPRQRCPTGCSRTEFCTKTATRTLPPSTRTITQTQTQTQTQTRSPITVTITPPTNSTAAPACKTEVPYANLFSFPDSGCRNSTGILDVSIPLQCNGLVGPPIKFNTLKPNPTTKYNESSCIPLPVKGVGARSVYFTVDGRSGPPYASCTMNLFKDSQCSGDADTRFLTGGADECLAANANRGPWKSALFKCAYLRDLCTDSEIFLGTCIKY